MEAEGVDLKTQFERNNELALDITAKRIAEMKTKYDACEVQLEKVSIPIRHQLNSCN